MIEINAIKLISNLIHILNQELEDIARMTLNIKININQIFEELII